MGAGLLRRHFSQLLQRRFAERAAGRGKQYPPHPDLLQAARIVARQALENRIVFAVDRQQHRTTLPHRLDKQRARHHQRFFVG
ncbi:hypothetical protein D9M68_935810 [compost metagenome]